MKKNLISVLILALLVVNIALTAIMVFSVMGTMKKTSTLVTNIASVLNIEIEGSKEEEGEKSEILIENVVTYDVPEQTILLKKSVGADGTPDSKSHYCLVSVSFMMDSAHEDYAKYGEKVDGMKSIIMGVINDVVGSHTMEECQADPEALKEQILTRIQGEFNSTFIYKVTFSNIIYQ